MENPKIVNFHSQNKVVDFGPDCFWKENSFKSTEEYLKEVECKLNSSKQNLRSFYTQKEKLLKKSHQNNNFSNIRREIKQSKKHIQTSKKLKKPENMSKIKSPNQKENKNLVSNHSKNTEQQILKWQDKILLLKGLLTEEEEKQLRKELQSHQNIDRNEALGDKFKSYFQNHLILTKFLEKFTKKQNLCPSPVSQKEEGNLFQQNELKKRENIYLKIKAQMVSVLINEEYFINVDSQINSIHQNRERQLKSDNLNYYKLKAGQKRPLGFKSERILFKCFKSTFMNGFSSQTSPLIALQNKIQQLLQVQKDDLKQAYSSFGKPEMMYEIELEFNKRKQMMKE